MNHDGRSNGLTAPHGPSQEAVMRRTGSGLWPAERAILQQRLDGLSASIRRQERDAQHR